MAAFTYGCICSHIAWSWSSVNSPFSNNSISFLRALRERERRGKMYVHVVRNTICITSIPLSSSSMLCLVLLFFCLLNVARFVPPQFRLKEREDHCVWLHFTLPTSGAPSSFLLRLKVKVRKVKVQKVGLLWSGCLVKHGSVLNGTILNY